MTNENISLYVGIDVSKDKLAVALAGSETQGEPLYLGIFENTRAGVAKLLKKLSGRGCVSTCYEAGPTGYGLYRQISAHGFDCCVVAPSLIPARPGDRVKTDRLDAMRLARLLRAGELTPIWVPDVTHEAMRDLVRARESAAEDRRHKRQLISAFLLRQGLTYGPMNLFFRHMFLSSAFAIALSLGFSGRVAAQSIDIGLVMDYDNGGVGLQAEYHANPFFERGRFSTRWATAARIDADRDLWAGVGIAANLKLTNSMFVEASIMPGLYHAGETALGSNFEVRSLVGVGAQVSTSKAFILSIDHTSNATTGRLNPCPNAVSLRLRSSF